MQKATCDRGKTSRKVSSQKPPKELGVFQRSASALPSFCKQRFDAERRRKTHGERKRRMGKRWGKLNWSGSHQRLIPSSGERVQGRKRRGVREGGRRLGDLSRMPLKFHSPAGLFTISSTTSLLFYRNCSMI